MTKIPIRRKQPGLTAILVTSPESVTLADGRTLLAAQGDFRIVNGTITLDVVTPTRFAEQYESLITGVLLTPADCARIEDTLGLGATHTGEDLVRAIERLASIKIGDIRIPFTPGQLSELQHRAQKRGRTVEQEMKAVVARIEDELFFKGG